MILTLRAVSLNDQVLTKLITARFDSKGGTIGRADHSTMVLPDSARHISRKQAEVVMLGDGFIIRNVGAANPIGVAGRMLVQGEASPLRHADEVRIGGYLLRAECRAGAPAAAGPQPGVHAAPAPPRVAAPLATVVTDAPASAVLAAAAPQREVPAPPQPAPATLPSSPEVAAAGSVALAAPDGSSALWDAFCEGAGVRLPLPPGSAAQRMQTIGRVLRSAVDGTLQLMAVRASTKHDMRAAVTQIQARGNNPLKFSPDATTGLEQLLQPAARGFLDGPAAIDDVMRDLVAHSIGTVAGTRAAIEGMLDRFDPAALERKLGGGSMLDSLLPMNRKSRLWELYLQHNCSIRDEAREDFHALFGKAFVAAYEQQVARLKRRGRS